MSPDDCARTIAGNIRRELVCCDAFERWSHDPEAAENRGHGLCFWGEAAARVALSTMVAPETPTRTGERATRERPDWRRLDVKSVSPPDGK